jgi:hypothetical protein
LLVRSTAAACALAALVLSARVARGDDPPRPEIVLVADPKLGMEGGARTVASLGHVLFEYELLLPRLVDTDESRPLDRGLGVLGRTLKLVFLD